MELNDGWDETLDQAIVPTNPLPIGHGGPLHQRMNRESAYIRAKIQKMLAMLTTLDRGLAMVDTHWNDPMWQNLVYNLRPRINAIDGIFWGHLNEFLPFMKHLRKGRRVSLGGRGDVVVETLNDNFPGKAIQLKSTTADTPGNVKPHLVSGFLQACGARRENPGNLRRIVQVILRDDAVSWPFSNLQALNGNELFGKAVAAVNDAYAEAAGSEEFTKAIFDTMSAGVQNLTAPQPGQKGAKTVLQRQYVGGNKTFEAVVTKILYENSFTVPVGTGFIDVAKLVFVTTIQPGQGEFATMTTFLVELIDRSGGRSVHSTISSRRSFRPKVVTSREATMQMLGQWYQDQQKK